MSKVIQPLSPPDSVVPESEEPAQPTATGARTENTNQPASAAEQNTPPQPQPIAPPPPSSDANQPPIGISANTQELNESNHGPEWRKILKKILPFAIIILLLGGGWLLYTIIFSGLSTQTFSNGGYTYTVEFFKPAGHVELSDGSHALKRGNVVLGIKPSDAPKVTSCSRIGNVWKEAFRVHVYGEDLPVCRAGSQGHYALYFTTGNQRHLFSITFKDAPSETIYPTLKTIFESVSVSQ